MSSIQNKKRVFISTSIIIIFLLLLWAFIPNDSYQSIIQFRNINSVEVTQDLLSEHCSVPFPGKPLIQYAVMVDAGSSGSRVHIYKFNFCKEEPELENEVFHMLEPGLSSFDDPERAADSLEELFQIAVDNVPLKLQRCTPIAVKATAGLRLLGQEKSKVILDTVRRRLETQYLFPISSVEIMDGKDEGVYAWITVNYLLGNFKSSSLSRSVATFDLGGASTQIVFEPEFPISAGKGIKPGDHLYELDYANHRYNLYQHSYLGYGLKEARKMIKTKVIELWQDRLPFGQIYHPCLPENYTEVISWKNESISTDIQLIGTGAGHAACRGIIEKIFNKEKVCPLAPCSFDGIYQPPLEETFIDRDLYVFSFFYDLTQPLGLPQEFTVREFGELANRVCSRDIEALKHVPNALHILKESPDYCLDLTYTHALLRIGYDISPERIVRTAKKINNAETGWCLGASIAMLNNNQLCRV
ncbi:nucleoside phosphatase GDA1/CD39 [Cokeromyces recurvatus]|uniref:nucleoside phosphatase GDA1/CD39 n=1 Tax=Cokeromyces recurvatus TaxID=90255 RepID=UPI0022202EE0|nr:nucleoside phosphatase GDA1/CD39 [Cokeromyces recurvatus]KAI7907768.1 nucleoside phosphatase GDA1/CD39 [Cokeromyces recurvatus]